MVDPTVFITFIYISYWNIKELNIELNSTVGRTIMVLQILTTSSFTIDSDGRSDNLFKSICLSEKRLHS